MVIFGTVPNNPQHEGKVQIINLKEPTLECPSIPRYPVNKGMFGTAIGSDEVMVCGGKNSTTGSTTTDKCYRLVKDENVSKIQITEMYSQLVTVLILG